MRLVAAAALALAGIASAGPAAAQDVAIALAPGEVLLRVEAEGVDHSRPDVMGINAGVVTTGRTAREALAANAVLADRLIAAVRAAGIAPRDVQTSELTVSPQFDRTDESRADREDRTARIIGYIARNQIDLRFRELAKASELIDALFANGANSVSGPHFALADPAPAEKRARRAAVAAALDEANTYAEAMNMRITRVLRVSERGSFNSENDSGIIIRGSRIPSTPLEPGELSTRITLWVDYAMAPR